MCFWVRQRSARPPNLILINRWFSRWHTHNGMAEHVCVCVCWHGVVVYLTLLLDSWFSFLSEQTAETKMDWDRERDWWEWLSSWGIEPPTFVSLAALVHVLSRGRGGGCKEGKGSCGDEGFVEKFVKGNRCQLFIRNGICTQRWAALGFVYGFWVCFCLCLLLQSVQMRIHEKHLNFLDVTGGRRALNVSLPKRASPQEPGNMFERL